MRIETTRLEIGTDEGVSIADVSNDVHSFVRSTGIVDGLCVMMVGRQECFLSLAPDVDDAFDDLMRLIRQTYEIEAGAGGPSMVPDRADTDTAGKAPPGFLAESISFAVRDGHPDLGSWEALLLVDAGGPARRAIEVTVMGADMSSSGT